MAGAIEAARQGQEGKAIMKEQFEEMVVEVVTFEGEDIITTSDSCDGPNQLGELPD